MRKVIMVQGTYGYRPEGSKHITPKSRGDSPFELPDDEAERLIGLGVAIPTSQDETETNKDTVATDTGGQTEGGASDNMPTESNGTEGEADNQEKPAYNADMKADDLHALLEKYSLPYKAGMTKADMVAALDAYFTDSPDDGEAPPAVQAEDPVK